MSLFLLSLLLPTLASALTPQSGTTYTISPNSFPNLCLAPSGSTDGSQLVTKDCASNDDIVWTYNSGVFQNTATNLCVDVTDGANSSGTKLQVWTCYPQNPNQAVALTGENINWSGTNMCWDLTDGQSTEDNQIQIWTCFDGNANQMWEFVEAEEVNSCDTTASNSIVTSMVSSSATISSASSPITSPTLSIVPTISASSSTSAIGGGLFAQGSSSSSATTISTKGHGGKQQKPTGSSATTSLASASSVTDSSSDSSSESSSSTSASGSSTTGKTTSGSGDSSGYLQTSGTKIVDSNGNQVILKGTNMGGWLVSEDWMDGISDESGNADRFMQNTLESRFGEAQTHTLLGAWYDNFITSDDWDTIASLGFNTIRLPFGFRNLQWANGSWITDSSGNIDFSRLDWAVAQAKQRNIYLIPVFHIWDTQQQQYSLISEDSDAGQASRDAAGVIWKEVATHFLGESTIAAFDAINEPTGSAGDKLQQDLYTAIRSADPTRIIVMESISTDPSSYGWTNVVYSWHEYNMMGDDYSSNQGTWQSGFVPAANTWWGYNIPVYLGEWMADSDTLTYILDQSNSMGIAWTSWCYRTVNMGRWGLYNLGGNIQVDVSSDSYDSILSVWSNLGSSTRQAVADQYQSAATSRKRDQASPRAGTRTKAFVGHSRRSRRAMQHGKAPSTF